MKRLKAKAVPLQEAVADTQTGAKDSSDLRSPEDSGNSAAPPAREDIETVAYLKFLAEGCQHGSHLRHWFEAENQLRE